MKTNNWTNIVYDIYDFLYWEPQHIGKIKNPQSSYDTLEKSMKHVKNMEVSLNQILNIFFYFLPNRIFSQLIESVTCSSVGEDAYTLYLGEIEDMIEGIKQSTQPDFFFLGNKQNISIEMKTRSQSSLEQLMKYIYLHIKDCERCGFEKQYTLVFLGKGDFSSLWKEEFTTIEDLQKAFENYEIPDVTKKGEVNLKPYKESIKDTAKKMNIGYLSYQDLQKFCSESNKEHRSDEIIGKLMTGLENELRERKLC